MTNSEQHPSQPLLLFVGGDRSQVGKSTVCMGLLGSLLGHYQPSELAYIKPVTQCEEPQLITKWCEEQGVACRGVGPVVFYAGFTRAFLKGEVGTTEQLLDDVRAAVKEISAGKRVVLVDGVGYPAVGSICGLSNAAVAAALAAPVILVGRSGVGDAVDAFNLNATFFAAHGVRVVGAVFNRLSTVGFYSLSNCREAVTRYFDTARRQERPWGFVPDCTPLLAGEVESAMPADGGGGNGDGGDGGVAAVEPSALKACGDGLVVVAVVAPSAEGEASPLAPFTPLLLWLQHAEGILRALVVRSDTAAQPHFTLYHKGEQVAAGVADSPKALGDWLCRSCTALHIDLSATAAANTAAGAASPMADAVSAALAATPQLLRCMGGGKRGKEAQLATAHVQIAVFRRHVDARGLEERARRLATEGVAAAASSAVAPPAPDVGGQDGGGSAAKRAALKTREEIEVAAALSGGSGCALKRQRK